jgi:peptidoglycan/xylan/chitin deacetylase (PgdA/CDA1 family)
MAASKGAVERGDEFLSVFAPKNRPCLVVVFMHCVFESDAEALSGEMDPHEQATVGKIEQLIHYFRAHGHRFISLGEIEAGVDPGGRYAHLTFDDGFANNLGLLDLTAQEEVYATVFPSINHVRSGKSFWWNSLYRELNRRDSLAMLPAETARLRRMTDEEIEGDLVRRFGEAALWPSGDADRPLSIAELRSLSESPWIEIGNHTMDHAVLTNYPTAGVESQIADAQAWLTKELSRTPTAIAYPNGDVNDEIAEIARGAGLGVGFTVESGLNRLPLDPTAAMKLHRTRILFDGRTRQRLRAARSPWQMTATMRRLGIRATRPGGRSTG